MAKEESKSDKGESKGNPDTGQLLDEDELDDLTPLNNDPGGPPPSKSILKIGSYKKDIANQFKEGEEIVLQVHARCDFIGFGGGKRIQEFDVLDLFQDEDLDESIVERFKDHLEGYDAPKKTKDAITDFLDACLEEIGGEPEGSPEQAAAAEEPEEPAETPESQAAEADAKAEPPAPAPAAAEEPPAEEVDGEVVSEPSDEPALEAAAGDLDWGEEGEGDGDE